MTLREEIHHIIVLKANSLPYIISDAIMQAIEARMLTVEEIMEAWHSYKGGGYISESIHEAQERKLKG
jgi:hypothetical protein